MNYWIFKANPKKYHLQDRLDDPDPNTTWAIKQCRHQIQAGDLAFIWRTGIPSGICAIIRIDTYPIEMEEIPNEIKYVIDLEIGIALRVKGTYIQHQHFPLINSDKIKKIPGLEFFSFFKAFNQVTNCPITKSEGNILLDYIDKNLAIKLSADTKTFELENEPIQTIFSNYDLLKCTTCDKTVMGYDTNKHIQERHSGQQVRWKKIR